MKWLFPYAVGFAITFIFRRPRKGDPDDWFGARFAFSALWPIWAQIVLLLWLWAICAPKRSATSSS